jgi:hypothetical protein
MMNLLVNLLDILFFLAFLLHLMLECKYHLSITILLQSFMDLQFPNGQLTYVAGEGFSASGFVPLFGGLLQAQGKYPGETRVSFSGKVSSSLYFHFLIN